MSRSFDVLVDSDAFVGLLLPDDAHFREVSALFAQFERQQTKFVTTNWVIAETATVLSYKDTQQTALTFLDMIETGGIPVLSITRDIEQAAIRVFKAQTTKKTSMIDCSNVAVLEHFHIPYLLSFDHFYTRFAIQRMG